MRQLLQRKSIGSLLGDEAGASLNRVMDARDLVLLAIGAVIGAGIFSSIGTAAAGEVLPSGAVVRYGAGPALILSFLLLGLICGLAALCYAELASMIPHAGSAYTYAYATLGELVAWIIGWDLVLEYAVGNIAVAIAWSGYFTSLLDSFGIHLPDFLTHGYRTALLSADPAVHGLLETAPRLAGMPILFNLPAAAIVGLITWLLYIGVKESVRANHVMVVVKLVVLALFVAVGAAYINPENYTPFAPNGWRGVHQGAAIVFFAYIGFDAISTAAEETKDPQRNMPRGILGGLAICTVIYIVVGLVATGLIPYEQLRAADPLAAALDKAGLPVVSAIVAFGAVVSITAVLLVFQYGQPRIFFAMARDGLLPGWAARIHPRYRTPHVTTLGAGLVVAVGALFMDENEIYDLTNIGTLSAFAVVSIGVLVLRWIDPDRPRPFRVPALPFVALPAAAACLWVMAGLPASAWRRFVLWLLFGLGFYAAYGYEHSGLRTRSGEPYGFLRALLTFRGRLSRAHYWRTLAAAALLAAPIVTVEPYGRLGQLLMGIWVGLGTWILLATTVKRVRDLRSRPLSTPSTH
jgi:APA family basic amino acid/polyamine antiporter